MKRSIAWAIGFTLAGAALAGACGNSVSDNTGGAGGSGGQGTGGTPVTTTPTGGNGTGGTVIGTGGSGGGTGGGDACTKACAHAEGCGQNVCSQLPIDCSTSQGRCLAECVNDGNCADINTAINALTQNPPDVANSGPVGICVVGCLTQGGTGGGGGAGGGGQTCLQCAQGDCTGAAVSCYGDDAPGGCRDWITCAGNCMFDTACTAGCDAMYPNAKPLYDPVYACACTSCPTACAAVDPCGTHGGSGGAGGAPN